MRRYIFLSSVLLLLLLFAPAGTVAAPQLTTPNLSIGKFLESSASIRLNEVAPEGGVKVTLTSSDPARLVLAQSPESRGSASLTLTIKAGFVRTPDFWLQALAGEGIVTYSASADGFDPAHGAVTLSPSALVMFGPLRAPTFRTVPGRPSNLVVYSARLNPSLDIAEQQAVAGGLSVPIEIASSNPKVGKGFQGQSVLSGGLASLTLQFTPEAVGTTTLSLKPPSGFATPAKFSSVTASVIEPQLNITDGASIGKNLQLGGTVSLVGASMPSNPVKVTLTSNDPMRLLLGTDAAVPGSNAITVTIPTGKLNGVFYLQALAGSGTATYTASAPGFADRTATINLTPSGVVITPTIYGPPDEAAVLNKEGPMPPKGFILKLSSHKTMSLSVWTVQLDPVSKRGADITVQSLRPGVTITVPLKSSNPNVGTIYSPVAIASPHFDGAAVFTPVGAGSTEISVETPAGFTTAGNATTVPAIVQE